MAVSKQLLSALLFTQFLLSLIIVSVLCSQGQSTIVGYISISAFAEIIALLVVSSTMFITSALLFVSVIATASGAELLVKTTFYKIFNFAMALLFIGSSIAVLAIEVPRKKDMPIFNAIWNRNLASAGLGIICGVVSGIHSALVKDEQ